MNDGPINYGTLTLPQLQQRLTTIRRLTWAMNKVAGFILAMQQMRMTRTEVKAACMRSRETYLSDEDAELLIQELGLAGD